MVLAAEFARDDSDDAGVPRGIVDDYAGIFVEVVCLDLFYGVLQDDALDVLTLLIDVVEFASGAVACCEVVAQEHIKRQ